MTTKTITVSAEHEGSTYTASADYAHARMPKLVQFTRDGEPAGHGMLAWQTIDTRENRRPTTDVPEDAIEELEDALLAAMGRYERAHA